MVCPYAWDRPGGVQSHIRSLAPILRSRGHDVTVLAPADDPSTHADDATLVAGAFAIPANGSVAAISFGPRADRAVHRAVRDSAPDVLHLHEPLIPSLSLLALRRASVPTVGTFHAAADKSLGYLLGRQLLSGAVRRLSARTVVSEAARDLVQRYFPGAYALTPNWIDRAPFTDAEPADLGKGPRIVFLGRLERRKGVEVLIQAMTRLRDLDCELIVAGSGPAEAGARRLVARLRVPARFLGRVSESEKAALFKRADVYCAPALGGESFGIVLLEAMAAGTPVVCSEIPGFRAVAGSAAAFFPPGDAGRLADRVREVLTDRTKEQEMRTSGGRIAEAFSWERLVVNLERIYEDASKEPTHV